MGRGSLPRMRGDRPYLFLAYFQDGKFTPHARGSTSVTICSPSYKYVYPACAGIDRACLKIQPECVRLPRMRGDRPAYRSAFFIMLMFTPHARGSTSEKT